MVSGIGFLGAGVIIKDGLKIRGLTTAATLLCDAAIGVLCASGAIYEAVAGTIVILFANVILRYVNLLINEKIDEHHILELYELKIISKKELINDIKSQINSFIKDNHKDGIELKGFDLDDESEKVNILFKICIPKSINRSIQKLIDNIYDQYEVKKIECNKIMEVQNEEEEEAL